MLLESVWAQAVELRRLLGRLCDPAAERVAAELGLNGPGWALLRRAYLAVPQPVSASRLSALNPGVNPWIYEAGLQHLAALGLLAGVEDGAYVVTPAGQSAATSILYALDTRLRELAPLAPEPLERLAELLAALVSASLLAPEPPRKTLLRLSHAPSAAGPLEASVRLDQALSDLAAYHEDAHLAAWQPHMVSGQAWDALSALWRGTPGTLDGVYARLARRGWPRDAVARALQELVRRDWVAGPEPHTLTPQGRAVRERAEAQTNTYFFAPWSVLDARAIKELGMLAELIQAKLLVAAAQV